MALVKPDTSRLAKIRVVSIGGGGSNAIRHMIEEGKIDGVEFIAMNTDAQVLLDNPAETKLQIGEKITRGLGVGGDPELGKKAAEESRERIKELLINSDDTAHKILIRNLAAENFEEMLQGLGMEDLYDKDYNITAKEYSRIFRSLYTSSFLKREYSQQLLQWLTETPFNEFLGGGVPNEVPFAHKIGVHDPQKTYLDSGIAYVPNRPYLLTVMVQINNAEGKEKAESIMKEISEKTYAYISAY